MTDDEAIARQIAGKHALPATLTIGDFRASLTFTLNHEEKYPSREELRDKLLGLLQAITTVRNFVADFQMQTQLLFRDASFDHEFEMLAGLHSLATRVEAAACAIRRGKGKDKHYVRQEGLSSQVNCALMVAIVWRSARGRWPPHNNRIAQEACLALWLSAGGKAGWNPSSSKSLDTWRDHLKAAKVGLSSPEAVHLLAMARKRGIINSK